MAKVLIIDDMVGVRRSIGAILKQAGHTILEAENGDVGVKLADAEKVDLVITDMMMPGRDGLGVVNHLRTKPNRPRILAISGGSANINPNSALEVVSKLVDGILYKPFQRNQLIDSVNAVITNNPRV